MFTLNRNSINCNLSLLFPLITLDSHFLDYISHTPLSHSFFEPGLWFLQSKLIPGRLCGPGSLTILLGASEGFDMCVCVCCSGYMHIHVRMYVECSELKQEERDQYRMPEVFA